MVGEPPSFARLRGWGSFVTVLAVAVVVVVAVAGGGVRAGGGAGAAAVGAPAKRALPGPGRLAPRGRRGQALCCGLPRVFFREPEGICCCVSPRWQFGPEETLCFKQPHLKASSQISKFQCSVF